MKHFYNQLEFDDLESFKSLSRNVFPLYKEAHLTLNFAGYCETVSSINTLQNVDDIDALFVMNKNLLFWIDYFEELLGCTSILRKQKENQIEYMTSFRSSNHFNIELEDRITFIENQKKSFLLYEKVLIRQIKKMKIIYKNVMNYYNDCVKNLTFSRI